MQLSKNRVCKRLSNVDPFYLLILPVVLFTFFCTALGPHPFFRHLYRLPCILFFAAACFRGISLETKKQLLLPALLLGWFVFLQFRQTADAFSIYPLTSFFCVYFFAFPLASMMQDSDKKYCMKLFGLSFIAASLCMAIVAFLLLLNHLPPMLTEHAFWDGARLHPFWHPNMAACLLMFGIASSLAFLQETNKRWIKVTLMVTILFQLATMAMTNCRTAILLTGGLLGGTVFFHIIKNHRKMLLPGCIAACAIISLVFLSSRQLFQIHYDVLLNKYITQYQQSQSVDFITEIRSTADEEEIPPINTDDATNQVSLKTESSQRSFIEDLASFNSRTAIWKFTFLALQEDPNTLLFGCSCPGDYISIHTPYPVAHSHNAWLECLLGLGIPGFSIALAFTLFAFWNSVMILLKHTQDVWKRTIALLVLCLMVAALMEPYLFLTTEDYHIFNFVFFLCTGYLVHWQEEDNRNMLAAVRKRLHI